MELLKGTSLEVIAPYLPYRPILVDTDGEQYTVTRLLPEYDDFDAAFADGRDYNDFNVQYFSNCLPLLYGYDDLLRNTEEHGILFLKLALELGHRAMGPFGKSSDHLYVYDHCEQATSGVFILDGKAFETGLFTHHERQVMLRLHLAIGLKPHQYTSKAS